MNPIENTKEQLTRMHDIYHYIKNETGKVDSSVLTILARNFYDEDAISDYLAYVLDPKLNGIGLQPLKNLLDLLEIPVELAETDFIDIQREYTLQNNRRIDFLITINEDTIIAIEHKIFSKEHGKQTLDYEDKINKSFVREDDNVTFVFLTPDGRKPLNDTFIRMSYYQLVTALKNVAVDFISDIRKAVLYNEIIFHLEAYFLHNKSIGLSDKTLLYLNNYQMIQELSSQFNEDYYNVFEYVKSVIQDYFENLEGEWFFDFKKDRHFHQIYKQNWKTKDLDIHFELSMTQDSLVDGRLSFMLDIEGVRKKDFKAYHDSYLRDKLIDILNRHNIQYREGNKMKGERGDTFAVKEYRFLTPENLKDESLIKNYLQDMIQEFENFIKPIDEEIERFYNNLEKQ